MSSTIKKKTKKQTNILNKHSHTLDPFSFCSLCVCVCVSSSSSFFSFLSVCAIYSLDLSECFFPPLSLSASRALGWHTHLYITVLADCLFRYIILSVCEFCLDFSIVTERAAQSPNHTTLFFFFLLFFWCPPSLSLFILLPSFTLLDPHACTPTSSQRSL